MGNAVSRGPCPPVAKEQQQASTNLLDLPAELRNQIYRYVVLTESEIRPKPWPSHLGDLQLQNASSSMQEPALARVNRRLRSESLSIYYGENTFRFDSDRAAEFQRWSRAIGSNVRFLRMVWLDHWVLQTSLVLRQEGWRMQKCHTVVELQLDGSIYWNHDYRLSDLYCGCRATNVLMPFGAGGSRQERRAPREPDNKLVDFVSSLQQTMKRNRARALTEIARYRPSACEGCGRGQILFCSDDVWTFSCP
ncbi:hypothetical protein LTR36_000833 [Oleoguttula mirabilis]|uniref:Uncharacterized protein n=1 Tax=Oleoguttula mirabilis TaxID=1507867 RepID=A0AAV9J3N7_9PEZI|nr:hypothetical protein LTR36_000833 [Oleoguttula mirabilis]